MDKYRDFEELRQSEVEGNDYRLVVCPRPESRIAVIAPHGGKIELHVDSRRFSNLAKEMDWKENAVYRSLRLKLIYASYITVGLATAAVIGFLVLRIMQTSA
jgi:phage replication-related protein YjqB (UPF0714/DUF867 family)